MSTNYKVGVVIDTQGAGKSVAELTKVDKAINNVGKDGSSGSSGKSFFSNLSGEISNLAKGAAQMGAEFEGAAAPIAAAAAGVAAVAVAGYKVGEALFNAAKMASDFGSEIQDAAEKTGLANDNLQALRYAAGQGGESWEDVSKSFSKFAKLLNSDSEESKKTLMELGVTSNDLNTALSQAYRTILQYPDGTKQMAAAQAAFGKSGSELLPFLKSFGGNMDELTEHARKLGLILSDESIAAADAFGDKYAEVSDQLKTRVAEFALQYAPQITEALEGIGEVLAENKDDFAAWGQAVNEGIENARSWGALIKDLATYKGLAFPNLAGNDIARKQREQAKKDREDTREFEKMVEDARKRYAGNSNYLDDLTRQKDAAEKLKKANETLRSTYQDLTSELAFFGQESEVSATKQKLINAGVYDFNSEMAKSSLTVAAQIDKLKAAKKEQDDYNNKLKDSRKELEAFSDKAFDDMLPPQNELDRFNRWVNKTKADMGELKEEVASTRDYLQSALNYKQLLDAQARFNNLESSIVDISKQAGDAATEFTPLQSALLNVAKAANLAETEFVKLDKIGSTLTSFNITDRIFARDSADFIDDYKKYYAALDETIKNIRNNTALDAEAIDASVDAATVRNQKRIDELIAKYKTSLSKLNTTQDGKTVPLFKADYEIEAFIAQIINLDAVVSKASLKKGLADLDKVFEDLGINIAGFGAKTELEKFNEWLADENVTKAIEKQAAAIHMQADALKELLRQQKAAQLQPATRPRVVGTQQESHPFSDGLFGEIGVEKITSEAEMVADVYKKLGATAGAAINQLAQGMGQLVENWVLYGSASGTSARKAIASALAMASAQSAVSAIMETAYGIAALTPWGAAIYGSPTLHFEAAALFAGIAVGTGLAGRAVAGNSFNQNGAGAGSSDQPDYYTQASPPVNSPSVRDSNQNFGTSSNQNQLAGAITDLKNEVGGLREKISSMPAEDVVVIGAKRKGPFLTDVVVSSLKSNGSKASEMGKALRLA
jgi:hypothetical protein